MTDRLPVRVKPGLSPWGPHVRFRRVQTLVREGSPRIFASGSEIADGGSQRWLHFEARPSFVAKNRYDLKLHNVDQHYIYVDVVPKNAIDKADFTKARLVLNKDSYLPRQIWFEGPNAGEVLWDITNMQSGVKIDPKIFASPQTPKDWKLVPGQTAAKPRVVRESSQK